MKRNFIMFLTFILLSINTVCLAEPQDSIDINLTQIPLHSKLKKEYKAYQYTIQNNGEEINLVNARIINGSDGSIAYQAVNNGHPIAKTWLVCGVTGIFTLGLGWAVGVVATPFIWASSNINSMKAQKEANSYSNIINVGYFKKGDVITVKTLVPISQQPLLKLKFKDIKTDQLYSITR